MDLQNAIEQAKMVVNGQTITAVGTLLALVGGGWGLWKAGKAGVNLAATKLQAPYVMAIAGAGMVGEGFSQVMGHTHHGATAIAIGATTLVSSIVLGTNRAEAAEKQRTQA